MVLSDHGQIGQVTQHSLCGNPPCGDQEVGVTVLSGSGERSAGPHDAERGAVAVLVCLVLVFVTLPAAAAGLGVYVRQAAAGELQQAAEAGALAGAARLPLSSQTAAITGLDEQVGLGGAGLATALSARDARVTACVEARRAGSVNDRMSGAFTLDGATQTPGGDCGVADFTSAFPTAVDPRNSAGSFVSARTQVSPLGACLDAATSPLTAAVTGTVNSALERAAGPAATAVASANGATGTGVGAANGAAGAGAGAANGAAGAVPGGVATLLPTPVPTLDPPVVDPPVVVPPTVAVPAVPALSRVIGPLLPALVRPRLQVVTRHRAGGPLDRLFRVQEPDEQVASAVAERMPKNAVVVPVVAPLPGQVQADLDLTAPPFVTVSGSATLPLPTVPVQELTFALANAQDMVSRALDTAATLVSGQPVTISAAGATATIQFSGFIPGAADCAQAIRDAQGDFDALVDPQTDTGSVLERASTNDESVVFLFVDPTYATVADVQEICLGDLARGRPDEFQIRVDSSTLVPAAQCAAAGSGAFRARLVRQ